MTPAQCRAGRGIVFLTQAKLAELADVPRNVVVDFEVSSLPPKPTYLEAMRQRRGVEFVDGEPPRVRPKV